MEAQGIRFIGSREPSWTNLSALSTSSAVRASCLCDDIMTRSKLFGLWHKVCVFGRSKNARLPASANLFSAQFSKQKYQQSSLYIAGSLNSQPSDIPALGMLLHLPGRRTSGRSKRPQLELYEL